MNHTELDAAMEAVLFASGSPVSLDRLAEIFGLPKTAVDDAAQRIMSRLADGDSGVALISLDGSYQLCTKACFAEYVKKALELKKSPPLSRAALEVLAIIAYHQPVTRSFIEMVRGVDSASIVSSLCDKGLIFENGHLDAPGRPTLFATTDAFLRCFGLSSIEDLPDVTLPAEGAEDGQLSLDASADVLQDAMKETTPAEE